MKFVFPLYELFKKNTHYIKGKKLQCPKCNATGNDKKGTIIIKSKGEENYYCLNCYRQQQIEWIEKNIPKFVSIEDKK